MIISAVTPILHFEVDSDLGEFLVEEFLLRSQKINNPNIFLNDDTIVAIGKINIDQLHQCYCFHFNGDSDVITQCKGVENVQEVAELLNGYISLISNVLWFVKDNSTYTYKTYVYDNATRYTWRNLRPIVFTNAAGEFCNTKFTKIELKRVAEILNLVRLFREYDPSSIEKPGFDPNIQSKVASFNYIPYDKSTNKISRALSFLDFARGSSFLPQKISFYVAILECLFTTDGTEVTHKVSERATFYLGGNRNEMLERFELIKTAYGIRSKYVHGDYVKQKRQEMVNISIRIDSLIRQILLMVLERDSRVFLKKNDELEQWFKDLIFK